MDFNNVNTLILPKGGLNAGELQLNMENLALIESRKREVAYVNKETAPELMKIFNEGYCEAQRMMVQVSYEYTRALKEANKRKSYVILEKAPKILKEKGLVNARSPGGSEDLRRAVLEADEEYLELQEKSTILELAYELLKGKAKGFEQSYLAVKKIYDISYTGLGAGHNLHSPHPEGGQNRGPDWGGGIGKARYG